MTVVRMRVMTMIIGASEGHVGGQVTRDTDTLIACTCKHVNTHTWKNPTLKHSPHP